jgi:lipopolysaccharide export system permease protein
VVYFNLLTLSQAWVAAGQLSGSAALLGIHGGVMLLSLMALWWRDGSWRRPVPMATLPRAAGGKDSA